MPVTNYYTVNGEIIGEETNGQRIDYLTDPLGNVTATIDQNAKVLNRYTYKPFGEVLSKTGTAPDPKFLWVGAHGYRQTGKKYADVYIRKRSYDTRTGRWTSLDPGKWPYHSQYIYGGTNPTNLVDPTGAQPDSCNYPTAPVCWPDDEIPMYCCTPTLRNVFPRMTFTIQFGNSPPPTVVLGRVVINIIWITHWKGDVYCPRWTMQSKTVSLTATSGIRSHQISGHHWHREQDPIPGSDVISERYSVSTNCETPSAHVRESMTLGSETFKFHILPDPVRSRNNPRLSRTELFVHPDGGPPGSAGCIAVHTTYDSHIFRSCMTNLRAQGVSSVPLEVNRN